MFFAPMIILALAVPSGGAPERSYLDPALRAARWIRSAGLKTDQGIAWPADPRDHKTVSNNLYDGNPGVVLFFLEAYRSTGEKAYLTDARGGADYLLSKLPQENEAGLYEGIAGIGFALEETFKATKDAKYRQGVRDCVQLLQARATRAGSGIGWNNTTDIISGSAGTGLFLLYAARELHDPSARGLAVQAGLRLIELARPEAGGLKWSWDVDPQNTRLMPNFSHGTAGIAFFLARLYEETKDSKFLDASVAGATYLKKVAKTGSDTCLIFHNETNGKDLYYLGWCHGPAGTARLFYELYRVTGDKAWMGWVRDFANAEMMSGIPEKQTDGFWNNVSQCCGSAGIAEFFLDLFRVTKERPYLDFSKRLTANLLVRATRDGGGLKWIQAEHRIHPELLIAQTGYMQGAAGIGMLLLHLDDLDRGTKQSIVLPDSPFRIR